MIVFQPERDEVFNLTDVIWLKLFEELAYSIVLKTESNFSGVIDVKMLIVLISLLGSFSTYAASNQDIHDCVVKSKASGSDTFLMYSIAKQCSGVQSVALVQQCVDETRHQDGFYAGDAATVCAGVKDLPALRQCIKQERADGFNDEELALLCTQR